MQIGILVFILLCIIVPLAMFLSTLRTWLLLRRTSFAYNKAKCISEERKLIFSYLPKYMSANPREWERFYRVVREASAAPPPIRGERSDVLASLAVETLKFMEDGCMPLRNKDRLMLINSLIREYGDMADLESKKLYKEAK